VWSGPNDFESFISNPIVSDTGIYTVVATNPINGCTSTDTALVTLDECGEIHCTLTQGFWGNANGTICHTGERGYVALPRLLSTPLIIGKPGQSLTITQNRASCLIARMPGGGPATTLPSGNGSFNSDCTTTTPIPLNNQGRFKNVLLTQTIALGLNMRLDTSLGSVLITGNWMLTQGGDAGADGLCGTEDDIQGGDSIVRFIPQSVIDALNTIYGSATIANLFDLANRALGGQSTGGASFNDINTAISAINEGFDHCAFLVGFYSTNPQPISRLLLGTGDGEGDQNSIRVFPNPLSDATTFEFTVAETGKTTLEVYNLKGQKLTTLFDKIVEAGTTQRVTFNAADYATGVYIYIFNTADKSYRNRIIISR
jgi:hypothetical protein